MIKITDALKLAHTKLKYKKLLTFSTIIISGLLFGALFAMTILATGIIASTRSYTHTALGGNYLVMAQPNIPVELFFIGRTEMTRELLDEFQQYERDYIAEQTARAKELGVEFDPASMEPILIPDPYIYDKSIPEDLRVMLNFDSPVYNFIIRIRHEEYVRTATTTQDHLWELAKDSDATAHFTDHLRAPSLPSLRYMPAGQEDISSVGKNDWHEPYGSIGAVRNSDYGFINDAVISQLILPANDLRHSSEDTIPVIITVDEAVELFEEDFAIPPKPSTSGEQITWTQNVQNQLNGHTYEVCYRNSTSIARIQDAARILIELERSEGDPDYVRPSLIYNLPTESCQEATVREDTRSQSEIAAEEARLEANKKLGLYEEPFSQTLTFQIVGFIPLSNQYYDGANVSSFFASAFASQYGDSAFIPVDMFRTSSAYDKYGKIIFPDQYLDVLTEAGIAPSILSFPSSDIAREFIIEQGCNVYATVGVCDRDFLLTTYGMNYLLVDDFINIFSNIFRIALIIITILAAIIIWFALSRVITDSRHETAVFRAIGAKRRDITAIYLLYSLSMIFRVFIFSLLIGVGTSIVVQLLFGTEVTNSAMLAFGVFDHIGQFSFIGINWYLALIITACMLGVGLISILPPLLRNVRRNPINDMRDE